MVVNATVGRTTTKGHRLPYLDYSLLPPPNKNLRFLHLINTRGVNKISRTSERGEEWDEEEVELLRGSSV